MMYYCYYWTADYCFVDSNWYSGVERATERESDRAAAQHKHTIIVRETARTERTRGVWPNMNWSYPEIEIE